MKRVIAIIITIMCICFTVSGCGLFNTKKLPTVAPNNTADSSEEVIEEPEEIVWQGKTRDKLTDSFGVVFSIEAIYGGTSAQIIFNDYVKKQDRDLWIIMLQVDNQSAQPFEHTSQKDVYLALGDDVIYQPDFVNNSNATWYNVLVSPTYSKNYVICFEIDNSKTIFGAVLTIQLENVETPEKVVFEIAADS